jgi:hypothetical protein
VPPARRLRLSPVLLSPLPPAGSGHFIYVPHCSGAKLGRYVPGSNSPTLICTEECFSPLHAFTGVLSV